MRNDRFAGRWRLARLALLLELVTGCGGDEGTDLVEPEPEPEPGEETGAIQVTNQTRGQNLDLDGFTLTVNGVTPTALATNGSVVFPELTPGTYTLAVTGVADNCRVPGGPTHSVAVAAGDTVEVLLPVACRGSEGAAPVISNVRGPARITVPGDTATVAFEWVDPDGDIALLAITIARDGTLIQSTAFDPGYQGELQGRPRWASDARR